MDSNFSIQEKNHESKKSLNQINNNPNRSTSVLNKKKTSFTKLLNPDPSINFKKLSKANFNEVFTKPVSKSSKKSLGAKTPEPKNSKNLKSKIEPKKIKHLKVNKKFPNENSPKRKGSKNIKHYIEVPQYMKENSFIKKESSIILKDSKFKYKKKLQENFKYDQKLKKAEIHQYVSDLNKATREENLKKFKHEKFKPKCAWGFDERRLAAGTVSKHLKDLEAVRKKFRSEKDRSKSAEKHRLDLNKSPDDAFLLKNIKRKSDLKRPKVQKSKDLNKEDLIKRIQKEIGKSPKRSKSAKSPNKKVYKKVSDTSYEEKQRNIWDDNEVLEILNQGRSRTPIYENPENRPNFTYKSTGFEAYLFKESQNSSPIIPSVSEYSPHKVEDTVQPTSATLMMTEGKELDFNIQNDESFKELPSLDISKRRDEIRKKLSELRNKVDTRKLKESVDEDILNKAAIKIQAFFRGWVVRVAVKKFEKYLLESASWESFQPAMMSEDDSEDSESESDLESKRKNTIKSKIDVDYVIKTESLWRDVQKEKLEDLKQKDFEDLSIIAKKMGSADIFIPYFKELLERRYENIGQIFDEHINAVKLAVKNGVESSELSETDLLSNIKTETEEEEESVDYNNYEEEEIKSELQTIQQLRLSSSLDLKNLIFYSGSEEQSLRISELELNSEKIQACSIATLSNRSKKKSQSSNESIRLSIENFSAKIEFPKIIQSKCADFNNTEPKMAVFPSDVVEYCETIVLYELLIQSFNSAWNEILSNEQFIESVVDQALKLLLIDGLSVVDEWELNNVISEKEPEKLIQGFFIADSFIKDVVFKVFDKIYEVQYDIDSALNSSTSLEPLDMLNLMQECDIGVFVDKRSPFMIIPNWILQSLAEFDKKPVLEFDLNTTMSNSIRLLSQKLIFDSLNEILSKKYALPHPMPWSLIPNKPLPKSSKYLLPSLISDLTSLNRLKSGKVPIVDMLFNSQDSDEDLVSQLREDHLSIILSLEIISQEPDWLNYEFEESQVKLDISDMALEDIVEETINLLQTIC